MADNTLRITFDFEPKDAAMAFSLFGARGTGAAIALLTKEVNLSGLQQAAEEAETLRETEKEETAEKPKKAKGPFGQLATQLYRAGFFYAPRVLDVLGTDDEYREWIQRQPSAFSGTFSEYVDGEGRCIAAHVRRADNAGAGIKPKYSCIPLTHSQHQSQHQYGESYLKDLDWDKAKNKYLILWGKSVFYDYFECESLTQIRPIDLCTWCELHDLMMFLPRVYREYTD